MKMLAIDTSTDYLSIAVVKDGKALAASHKKAGRRHSILLVPTIDRLLKKAKLKVNDIDCIAVSVGPGSFTGLRISVTVVKALAYALKKRIIAVPTMDVIAYNAVGHKGIICTVLDARKNKVYACFYSSDGKKLKRLSKYLLLPLDELLKKSLEYDKVVFLGDMAEEGFFERSGLSRSQDQILLRKIWFPRAEVVAKLGAEQARLKKFVRPEDLEPMYIYSRECDITGK